MNTVVSELIESLHVNECVTLFNALVQSSSFVNIMKITCLLNLRETLITCKNIQSQQNIKDFVLSHHSLSSESSYHDFFCKFIEESTESYELFTSVFNEHIDKVSLLLLISRFSQLSPSPPSRSKRQLVSKSNQEEHSNTKRLRKDEDECVIEKIVDHFNTSKPRIRTLPTNKSKLKSYDFLVKWENSPDSDNLWLPYNEIKNNIALERYLHAFP